MQAEKLKGAPDNESKTMMLAQIEHKLFDQLVDCFAPQELLRTTKDLSSASDAEWEQQYEALGNLRLLNKFHFALLCSQLVNSDQGEWASGFLAT
jgi:hypothetical protein